MDRTYVEAGTELDLAEVRGQVDGHVAVFIDSKGLAAAGHGLPGEIVEVLRDFLFAGGKRLRPLLCVAGWQAAGAGRLTNAVVGAAASLEMFHAFTLIHDDLMDESPTRRGKPTVHHTFAAVHAARPDAQRFGISTALLLGDLALAWSDELLHGAGLDSDQLSRALAVVNGMRTEVMYGQYLDLVASGTATCDVETALKIAYLKTATYTVERPLHLGAVIAGADDAVLAELSAYGRPLGEAFQLRDDLLGVFGEIRETGKPRLDDLRDGKHTALLALAYRRADTRQRQILRTLVGDPALTEDEAHRIRAVLTATGAREEVERMIRVRSEQAHLALDRASFPMAATTVLRRIIDAATSRTV